MKHLLSSFLKTNHPKISSRARLLLWSASLSLGMVSPALAENKFSASIFGRVQLDYNHVNLGNAAGGFRVTELRRARLGIKGKYGDSITYKAEFNTNSGNEVNIEDAYVQFTPDFFKHKNHKWSLKIGQFKQHVSLDEQTSSRFITTLERAAFTDTFEFTRNVGVSLNAKGKLGGKAFIYDVGLFTDNINAEDSLQSFIFSTRASFLLVKEENKLFHLGGSFRYRNQAEGQPDLRYRQRPYAHIPGRIIATDRVGQTDIFAGAEALFMYKNLWAAGEYGYTLVHSCPACASNEKASFGGGYMEIGAMIGGKRSYANGKWARPIVNSPVSKGGKGALSFVGRYDSIELTDAEALIEGGAQSSFIIGLDWWPVNKVRFGVNYFNNNVALGTSTSGLDSRFAILITKNTASTERVDGFLARVQFDF